MLPRSIDRRRFLTRSAAGFGGMALSYLLHADGASPIAAAADRPMPRADLNGGMHHKAKAKRVVQLYMSGAASQCDMFDYKPQLIKKHGEQFDPGKKIELFQSNPGTVMKSPWDWKQYGKCGKWMSDLVPQIGGCVDDIAFLPAMHSKSNVHGPATFLQATGFVSPGFPGMGSWICYGLGRLSDNLPSFVVLPDSRGFAPNGPANWGSGFLPAEYQGTIVRPNSAVPIFDLFPPESAGISAQSRKDGFAALNALNSLHRKDRPGDSRLDARIDSYELAAKMQTAAPEVFDLSKETAETKRLYGIDRKETSEFGTNCLIARRFLERGVRFVQIWSGADNGFPRRNWDSHEDIDRDHGDMGTSMDRPTAALIRDLRRLGLLDDTIVYWTTEFGRMPCSQGSKGRDHNPDTFTSWVAGGGFKGGVTYGASDEWSWKAQENRTEVYDLHATILHLLGIDHEKLTYRHNGIDRRLTDVHGEVIGDLLR